MNKWGFVLFSLTIFFVNSFDVFCMRPIHGDVNKAFIRAVKKKRITEIDDIYDNYCDKLTSETINKCYIYAAERCFFYPLEKYQYDPRLDDNIHWNAEFIFSVYVGSHDTVELIYSWHSDKLTPRTLECCCRIAVRMGDRLIFDKISKYFNVQFSIEDDLRDVLTKCNVTAKNILKNFLDKISDATINECYRTAIRNQDYDMLFMLSKCTRNRGGFFCNFINAVIRNDLHWFNHKNISLRNWAMLPRSLVTMCHRIAVKKNYCIMCKVLSSHPAFADDGPLHKEHVKKTFCEKIRGAASAACRGIKKYLEQLPKDDYIWD